MISRRLPCAPNCKQVHGRTVLADCYNANPASMEAALATLITLKRAGKAIAVLGDMLELGMHRQPRRTGRSGGRPRGSGWTS